MEFSVHHHRQRCKEIIKEQSWRFGCGPRQDVKLAVPVFVSYRRGHLVRNETVPKAAWVRWMTSQLPDLYVNLNGLMLPTLGVLKTPYESSLAPKQTVNGVICIHLIVGKRTSTYVVN